MSVVNIIEWIVNSIYVASKNFENLKISQKKPFVTIVLNVFIIEMISWIVFVLMKKSLMNH